SDFSDIRFTDVSNNLFFQWRESYTASTSAIFWVEIPSIPASPPVLRRRRQERALLYLSHNGRLILFIHYKMIWGGAVVAGRC
ncbi:MAG: DUF2341 domain-containing protein, partial [Thermodesulfobacteriota bacterium]